MPQMLMITVKYVLIIGSFLNRKIYVPNITIFTFSFANVSSGLSGVHWQQTL